jgi:ketosteroid isomerase-like protein
VPVGVVVPTGARLSAHFPMDMEALMITPVDTVRRFYDALSRGDVPAVLSLLDAQVQWTEAERFPYYSGTWQGPQAVLDNLLKPLSSDWEGFSAKAHEFIAEGDRVVSLGVYSGTFKRTGRSMTAPFAHVWTVRGDKLVRFDMHTDTAKVLEALKA